MKQENHPSQGFQNSSRIPLAGYQKKYLIFALGGHFFSLEILPVTEIVRLTRMSQATGIIPCIKGVFNYWGTCIPVVDIRSWFGYPLTEYDQNASIAVMHLEGEHLGMVMDRVIEIAAINEEQFQRASHISMNRFKPILCSQDFRLLKVAADQERDIRARNPPQPAGNRAGPAERTCRETDGESGPGRRSHATTQQKSLAG
jgi:chemotaxis signal transduction protein